MDKKSGKRFLKTKKKERDFKKAFKLVSDRSKNMLKNVYPKRLNVVKNVDSPQNDLWMWHNPNENPRRFFFLVETGKIISHFTEMCVCVCAAAHAHT